ncbi:6-phosphogluconolactonase [Spiribacter onubensis]|uniref:6-phosphogluconolactonase n=1 Tax=Spiribacter onubensis TaxID=3122420 RepID=A0ABV3S9A9_9GAMM
MGRGAATPAMQTLEAAQRFASPAQAAGALAQRVGEVIRYGVRARGRASLLVPGGRTPVPVFERLRQLDLPWDQVYVSLTDERRVPEDDPRSNARLVRTHLLQNGAARAHFYPLHREGVGERADEAACGAALGLLPRPFDAVVLGMGSDGHTASMFPDDPALARALDTTTDARCVATQAPDEPRERLTLTLNTLLQSRWIALHVTGAQKWATLQAAVASDDPRQYPVHALLNQRHVPVHVYYSP